MEAYGIFEGGGAKGLAHVGALKAAENRRINFHGVAGTSAGAIVASLIAAGYSSDELFNGEDPCDTGKIYSEEFLQYFGPKWRDFVEFIEDTTSIINHAWPLWAYLEVPGLILRNWSID
jgi:predicted acylesterase/phospholipase RssA